MMGYVLYGTDRNDNIDGTAGNDDIYGYAGSDSLFGGRGDDFLDGGSGLDEAFYNGYRDEYSVLADGKQFWVKDQVGSDGLDLLKNIERLNFKDGAVALDIDGNGGEAYRLYQAAFNRAPDEKGLGYWIAQLDHGASLRAVAAGFASSGEFLATYGANASNGDVVMRLYANVLHRAPDQAGFNYWVNVLNTKQDTVAGVLAGFSESQENYAQLIGKMQDGVDYQPWV
jgi:Ca2+-binding RTX toxin-like protein